MNTVDLISDYINTLSLLEGIRSEFSRDSNQIINEITLQLADSKLISFEQVREKIEEQVKRAYFKKI